MIDFTTILREDEHAFVVTIPVQAVIDFLRGGTPSVVMVDDVPMEFRSFKTMKRNLTGLRVTLHFTKPCPHARFGLS